MAERERGSDTSILNVHRSVSPAVEISVASAPLSLAFPNFKPSGKNLSASIARTKGLSGSHRYSIPSATD